MTYKLSTKSQAQSGKIAVVGERELVMGYRLLGVEDAFIPGQDEAQRMLMDLFNSNKYGLIIVGSTMRKRLSRSALDKLESSIIPLVVFMPSLDSKEANEESLSLLARRVLGVDLKVNA
ncbi:MAG: V-type ATP synthase subunit F [Rhabdochlamydiaceae bacterium]